MSAVAQPNTKKESVKEVAKDGVQNELKRQESPFETGKSSSALVDLSGLSDIDNLISSDEEDKMPRKVPKYKVVKHYIKGEKLGKGMFGTVREFVHKVTLKRYAGKIIKRDKLCKDSHLREQINKELAIAYHFNHPNIIKVYDLYHTTQKIYMFMEFCCGELGEFITAYGTLSKCQSKDYFGQICEGLDYLHSRGVIHRDIKPANVLVSHSSKVLKLADFGVYQNVSLFSLDDTVGGTDGSPLYMPPELHNESTLLYSGSKIDIWAAGVILYQMTVGVVPFLQNGMNQEDVDAILHKNPYYPEAVQSNILLHDLFNKLFDKNFAKRISIDEIRKHAWMQMKCTKKKEHYKQFPTENLPGDCYRSMTVLTRIHEKLYPTQEAEKSVTKKEWEESTKIRPLVRGQRILSSKKSEIKRNKVNYN